jgi:hypothetical protein
VHFHNLLGDGETKSRSAFGLGVRAVDLMVLLEDARLFLPGNSRAGVRYADREVAVGRSAALIRTSPVIARLRVQMLTPCSARCS